MRNWAGNFVSDCASDFVAEIAGKWVEKIEYAAADPSRLEPDEYYGDIMPCLVELLATLHELTGTASIPRSEVVARWRTQYMTVWEGYIDQLDPAPGYKEARRAVLLATFDRLERQSQQLWN